MTRPAGTKLGPTARKINPVGTPSAARASTRRHRAAAQRETVGEHLSSYGADIDSRIGSFPLDVSRWLWRWRDWTLGPLAAVLALALIGFLRITAWYPWWLAQTFGPSVRFATGLTPIWLTTLAVAAAGARYGWTLHSNVAERRRIRIGAEPIASQYMPRPFPLRHDVQDHRIDTDLIVPPGHTASQYCEKAPVLTAALKHPVTIRELAPGIVRVRQHLVDLLAQPVPWRDIDPTAGLIFLGITSDGDDVWWDPLGASLLIGGMRGSGKSALLKLIVCQVHILGLPLSLIDLEGGPNFGRLRKLATNLATTVPQALDLLERLNDEREANLLALSGDDAPDAFQRVTHVLAVDEMAMLTRASKPHAKQAREFFEDFLERGRKPAFTLIAATQHPDVAVLPTSLQGQFTHTLGLRTEYRMQTNTILGAGAIGDDWDLSTILPSQPGRGLWKDGPRIVPVRTAGLYGDQLRTVVRTLTERQQAAVDAVDSPLTHRQEPVVDTTSTLTPSPQKTLSTAELQDTILELAQNAGPAGIRGPAVAAKLDVSESRVLRACQHWRDRNQMRTDGTRWYWEGPT